MPAAYRQLACDAGALAAAWLPVAQGLLAPGKIPRTTRELAALAALAAGRVTPPGRLLRASLERRGLEPDLLDELERGGSGARLPERTQDVIAFLRRAALQPALVDDADYTRLRRRGLSEPELAELVAAAAAIGALVAVSRTLGDADG